MKLKFSPQSFLFLMTLAKTYESHTATAFLESRRIVVAISKEFEARHTPKVAMCKYMNKSHFHVKLTPPQILAFNSVLTNMKVTDPEWMDIYSEFLTQINQACLSI